MSSCNETRTIYPYRDYRGADGHVLKVDTSADGNDVDHSPHHYDAVNLPGFSVKVPSLMTLKIVANPGNVLTAYQAMFRNRIRNQIGIHSWIILDEVFGPHLQHAQTYYKGDVRPKYLRRRLAYNMRYRVTNSFPYQSALPAFGEGGQLLLGVGFPYVTQPPHMSNAAAGAQYRRTFVRHDARLYSNLSFDITEDFIRPGVDVANQPLHYSNPNMYDNNSANHERTFAFYVCRGARLFVGDDMSDNYQLQAIAMRHNRTLYQQGSLVIFRGVLMVDVGVTLSRNSEAHRNVDWVRFVRAYLNDLSNSPTCQRDLDDVEEELDNLGGQLGEFTRAHTFNNPVIFLGNCESHLNSLTWGLNIDRSTRNNGYCCAYLKMPENGVIEDIAPWNTGFGLIWARHQYERLWESVVGYPPGHPVPQFEAPQDEYWLRRILGLNHEAEANEWWGRMVVNYPYDDYDVQPEPNPDPIHLDTNILGYIRDYFERSNELQYRNIEHLPQWCNSPASIQYLPPAPPHLPPFKIATGRYSYLGQGVKVMDDPGHEFEITGHGNRRYAWAMSDEEPGYVWVPWTQPKENALNQWKDANPDPNGYDDTEWFRWSVDGKKWIKWYDPSDYTVSLVFLQRVQNADANEDEDEEQ